MLRQSLAIIRFLMILFVAIRLLYVNEMEAPNGEEDCCHPQADV